MEVYQLHPHGKSIEELLSILPDPSKYEDGEKIEWFGGELSEAVNASLPKLREAVNNCPACIMATLRQAHIPVPMATDFNFTEEMKAIWDAINDAKVEEAY